LNAQSALTHVDRDGRPAMVDVSAKAATAREAVARCRVAFPAAIAAQLRASGLRSKKGAVIDTAIVAGTMAVKRTHELIPFCHSLPIDGCRIAIDWDGERSLAIECAVRTVHRTGVEMEALTGATVAALTVYDMCKALSHAIVLGPARLLGKRGGKRDFGRSGFGDESAAPAATPRDGGKRAAAGKRAASEPAVSKPAVSKPAVSKPAVGGPAANNSTASTRASSKRAASRPVRARRGGAA